MGMRIRHDLVEKVIRQFGGQEKSLANNKKTLVALYGAGHLNDKGAALVRKSKIVVIASERTKSLKNAFGDYRTIWINRLTPIDMEQSLQKVHPQATPAQVKSATQFANGDLRKARIHINFESKYTDKSKHVSFDVQDALCSGAKKEFDYHCRQWLSENHFQVAAHHTDHTPVKYFENHVVLRANHIFMILRRKPTRASQAANQ